MGAIGTVHFAYGFGSLWTSTGDWDAAGSKDSKGRDGCGDRSESFGEGEVRVRGRLWRMRPGRSSGWATG